MTVSMDQFLKGVSGYYETEFCQKASGIDKFAAYFMLPTIPSIIKKKLEQFRGSPLMEGLMDQDGIIDLDVIRDRASEAMKHCGSLDVMGFRLNADDVDKLYDTIRRA